jgi:phosphatidylglycerophosphatase A
MFSFAKCFASYCYVGFLPKAPGTWGSLFALPLAYILYKLGIVPYTVAYLLITFLGIWSSKIYSERVNKEDPDEVVIDEVAGILTVFFFVKPNPYSLVLAFFLFRFFDILKPPPVNWLEKLPHGVGIMLDDIAAGVLTGITLWGLSKFFPIVGG